MAVVSGYDEEVYSNLKDFLDSNPKLKQKFKEKYFDIDNVEDWLDELDYLCMSDGEAIYELLKDEEGIHIILYDENEAIKVIKFYEGDIVEG